MMVHICTAHQSSLPASARPATSRSSPYWAGSRPRSSHHQPSAAASRTAVAGSRSSAQASTCRMVASSASSHRAAAISSASAGLQPRGGLPGHPQRVPGQRGGGPVLLPGPGQQPGPVGAQRLQHLIPGPAIRTGLRRAQQRAVHQVQHRRPRASPGDRLGRLQRERAREHRHQPEHLPLVVVQQLVAPLDGGCQRPVPPGRQPVPAGQQREPVVQAVQQLRHPQCLHPGRRQLDRQRHPVQPRHDLRHRRPAVPVQREPRVGPPGPVREQRHRLRPARAPLVFRTGQGQRR